MLIESWRKHFDTGALENLEPPRLFKIRAAVNALKSADPEALRLGVPAPSAGNVGLGLAWRREDGGAGHSLPQIVAAVRLLATRHHLIAEGAGAAAVSGRAGQGDVGCIVAHDGRRRA